MAPFFARLATTTLNKFMKLVIMVTHKDPQSHVWVGGKVKNKFQPVESSLPSV